MHICLSVCGVLLRFLQKNWAYGKAKNLLKKFAENLRRQNYFFCRNLSKFGNKRTLLLKFDAHLLVTRCSIGLLSSFSTHSWLKRPFRKFSAAELFWLQEKWRRNFGENCFFFGAQVVYFFYFSGPKLTEQHDTYAIFSNKLKRSVYLIICRNHSTLFTAEQR